MNALLFAAALAATPITLEQARSESRDNAAATLAQLNREIAGDQSALSRSAIFPHLALRLGAAETFSGQSLQYFPSVDPATGKVVQVVQPFGGLNSSFTATLGLSQLLYDGGRWWNQILQSGDLEEAAQAQLNEQRASSELEGVRRFYELMRAQRTLELLEATVKRSDEQVARAKAMFEAGRATKADAISAEVNLGNDRISALRQKALVAAAQSDLATWLAHPGEEELVASDPGSLARPVGLVPALDQALKTAERRRAILSALHSQLRAAELGTALARSAYLPSVSANATYSRQSPAADTFLNPAYQNNLTAGLSLQWDLFSGLGSLAASRQARTSLTIAEVNLAQSRREVAGDVRRSVRSLQAQIDATQVAVKNRELAARGLTLAEERFRAGAGSTLEVRDAQLKLTQAEVSALGIRMDVEIARAGLERVMGVMGALP